MAMIASINLNKRFNSAEARGRFGQWLVKHDVNVVLAQEPWKVPSTTSTDFGNFTSIGGNQRVFSWINSRYKVPSSNMIGDFCQRLEIGYLAVYSVYLDAYERQKRAAQLDQIRQYAISEGDRPLLIMGDFNIAPEPEDGLVNSTESGFNSETDRSALLGHHPRDLERRDAAVQSEPRRQSAS